MSDYNNYNNYNNYDDYDECKKYEDYEEYEDYDEDGFLDYLRNLLFSPRSLGEQIKKRPEILRISLLVFVLIFIELLLEKEEITFSIIVSIVVYLSILIMGTSVFALNKHFAGDMTYKEALSVCLFIMAIRFVGMIFCVLIGDFATLSWWIGTMLGIWSWCIMYILIQETSYLETKHCVLITIVGAICFLIGMVVIIPSLLESILLKLLAAYLHLKGY